MKTTILTLVFLVLSASYLFCQTAEIMTEKVGLGDNKNSQKYRTFHFHETVVDPSIFQTDRIILYNNKIKAGYPKIELYKDSKFCFFYNVKLKTITKKDKDTGNWIQRVVQTSDKIIGDYGMISIAEVGENGNTQDVGLTFHFDDKNKIKYEILDKGSQVVLIKKE